MRSIYLIIFVWAVFIANAQTTTNDWSKRIKSKTIHPLASYINPHISPVSVLIIDGKHFEHVRGQNKYYLKVPNTNSIVFVTVDENYHPTYHVFNMDTDEDVAFHSQSSMSDYGETFGSSNPRDTVTIGDDGIIILCTLDKDVKGMLSSQVGFYSMKHLYYLDLNKRAIVADKIFYYDKGGKVIDENDASPPY